LQGPEGTLATKKFGSREKVSRGCRIFSEGNWLGLPRAAPMGTDGYVLGEIKQFSLPDPR
jgi:hypothetical protein